MQAREMLARQLKSQDRQPAVTEQADEQDNAGAPSIPLPRARPVEANLAGRSVATAQAGTEPQGDQRTVLQKLSDLWPGRITLASLTPGGGLFRRGPDLEALGYDSFTAVYDISARAVYLPGGTTLEAHSGLGGKMDKIEYVGERMVGVTPPGAYDLKPRERLFHGVKALRMTPVDTESALGRTGLLVHNYLLGPDGASNGCVSIREYERFLKAFEDGQVTRLVVVVSLSDSITAARRAPAPS
jgi:Tlde1 domain